MQLSVKETALLLSVAEKTVYRWIKQGIIPAYRINEQFRFNRSELLEWATARRIRVSPDIFLESESNGTPMPTLTEALTLGGVVYRLGGNDRPSLLRAVASVMKVPEEVDLEFLYQVLLAREKLGSTAIGEGIAIPHVRNPIVLHVTRPTVTLCFLERPLEFGALDGLPVTTLFAIISPTVRAHLHLLSRLSFVLRDAGFRDALKRQASREELMAAVATAEEFLAPRDPPAAAEGSEATRPALRAGQLR